MTFLHNFFPCHHCEQRKAETYQSSAIIRAKNLALLPMVQTPFDLFGVEDHEFCARVNRSSFHALHGIRQEVGRRGGGKL